MIVLALVIRHQFFTITTTKADRDISLSNYGFEFSAMSLQDYAANFFMGYYRQGASEIDPSIINTPYVHYGRTGNARSIVYGAVGTTICDWNTTRQEELSTHEDWFAHALNTDWTNADNRCHSKGYNELSMDITNLDYRAWAIPKIVACANKPGANGVLIDLIYSNFRDCGFIIKRAERYVTTDGLTITVNNTMPILKLVGGYVFPILITTDSEQTLINKYGGSYTNRTINLIASDWRQQSTNADLEYHDNSQDLYHYPDGIKPKDFNVGYNTSITRSTDAHNGSYSWNMRVVSTDNNWMRRITAVNNVVAGVNGTTHFSAWMKNLGNATKLCVELERRRLGVAYGGAESCFSNPPVGEWINLDIVYRIPLDSACGGQPCDQILPWAWVKEMNSTTAEVLVDDFVFETYVGVVPAGTSLYITYPAVGSVPDENAPYYKDYHTAQIEWLQEIRQALGPNKYLLFNEMEGSYNADYAPYVDGAQEEGFVRAYWNTVNTEQYMSDWFDSPNSNSWSNNMRIINDTWEATNKINSYYCGVYKDATNVYQQRVFDFCFYSFMLLSKKNRNAFLFTGYRDSNKFWYWDEYDYKYGTPENDYHVYYDNVSYKIYGRDFTNSLVLVNPFRTANVIVNLNKTYYTVEGEAVSSIFLTNRSGVVLFKKEEDLPVKENNYVSYIIVGAIMLILLVLLVKKKK